MRVKFSQTYKKITASFGVDYFLPLPYVSVFGFFSLHEKNITRTPLTIQFATPSKLSISNKINVYSRLVLFPLYFTKFSLNTVSIRIKFGSSKEKITTWRMYIYLIPDTYKHIKLALSLNHNKE